MSDFNVVKGTRIRALWMDAKPLGTVALAGMQLKTEATPREVTGVVTHIYGDRPVDPTKVELIVQPDDGSPEVTVDPKHVVEIIPCS